MRKLYLLFSTLIIALTPYAQTTVSWNFGTTSGSPSPSSGTPISNLTISDVSQGNNNGTTTLLTTTSASSGYTGASGTFNAGAAARTGALNINASGSAYFEFTLTPNAGFTVNISNISFGSRSTSTGPQAFSIRSSLDGYASDVATGTLSNGATWALNTKTFSLASTSAVTFRIYGYSGSGSASAGTANWRIDDLSVIVSITGGGADTNPPLISSISPSDNATDVSLSFTAAVNFNENVQKVTGTTGNIYVKRGSDNTIVQTISVASAGVTINNNVVNFNVSGLSYLSAYYILIDANSFSDLSNNNFAGITDPTVWNFTTGFDPLHGSLNSTYSFNTCSSTPTDGFTQYSVTGAITWACTTFGHDPSNPTLSAANGVQINGYSGGTNVPNIDWFISPSFDLTATTFPLLSFWSRTAFNGSQLELKVSTDYSGTGDPAAATWTTLNGKFPGLASDVWTQSANINLSAYKGAHVYIAFVYTSTDEEGARWTLDDIRIDNSATPPPPSLTVGNNDIQYTFVASGSTSNKTFAFTANDITGNVTVTSSSPNFLLSKDGAAFSNSITYTVAEANNSSKTVYVQFAPDQMNKTFSGSVTINTSSLTGTVNVKGTSIDPAVTLEVVNWNMEWFGSTDPSLGPTNDALQQANAQTILQNIGADVYGLVEVVDEARLATIVSNMPGYSYVICNYGSHVNPPDPSGGPLSGAQKEAFVYKTSMFSNISTRPLINNQDISSTSYNSWSSGRYPFLMKADVTLNGQTKTINFVLIHAKANTSPTTTSYARRQAAATELHDTLNTYFPNDNIIVLGDFNDDLDQSITSGFTTTSYSAFTTDNANFFSPTLALSLAGKKSTVSFNDVIDHVMLSNEMKAYYMGATASVLTDVAALVSNYGTTTTDHYPVFTRYAFDPTICR